MARNFRIGTLAAFREICAVELDDGFQFDTAGLTIDRIRDEAEYGGLRLKAYATIAEARLRVTVDIGFGDAVEPEIEELELPVLLDLPSPRIRAYPRETVIAEKFQAMVMLGRANSRMKDFYDVWLLSRTYEFKGRACHARLQTRLAVEKRLFWRKSPTLSPVLLLTIRLSSNNGIRLWRR